MFLSSVFIARTLYCLQHHPISALHSSTARELFILTTQKEIEGEVFIWLKSKTFCDSQLHLFDTAKKAVDTGVQDQGVHNVGFACFIQPRCFEGQATGTPKTQMTSCFSFRS